MASYLGWGLSIASPIRLPGALIADGRTSPDIVVTQARVAPDEPDRVLGPYSLIGGTLVVTVPEVGRFACRPDAVIVEAFPGADPREVQALLIATALPAAIWMRGDIVLHAAAVEIDGRAVAIAGPSGAGKSRLVHAFQTHGLRVVADDTIRLRCDDAAVVAAGLPACYFNRAPNSSERREYDVPPPLRSIAAPLTLVAELDPSVAEISAALDGVAAVATLLRNRHRPRITRLLRSDGLHLADLTRIARMVPVVRCPLADPAELVEVLLRHGAAPAARRCEGPEHRR